MARIFIINFIICLLFLACQPEAPQKIEERLNTLETLKHDMSLPHEGELNGLPSSFDWSQQARIGWGNNPPEDWFAVIPWGQVYRDPNPVIAKNTRIHIRNLQAWYLSKANKWTAWIQSSDIFGKHYLENYEDDINVAASIRQEGAGGISVAFKDGYNFHFWPTQGRVDMNPQDIKAVWVAVEARLILDDSEGPDDREEANFLLGAGGDYWRSLTAEWDNFKSSGDIAIGRMKYLSTEWKAFNMHTLSPQQLNSAPPPY
ncbi:MAG: hypothetical protein AAFY71_25075 [Bacteroidota bacterium]